MSMRRAARCTGGRVATQLTGGARGCAVKLGPLPDPWLSCVAIAAPSVRRTGRAQAAPTSRAGLAANWQSAQTWESGGTHRCSGCSSAWMGAVSHCVPECHASAIDAMHGIAICIMAKNSAAWRKRCERRVTGRVGTQVRRHQ